MKHEMGGARKRKNNEDNKGEQEQGHKERARAVRSANNGRVQEQAADSAQRTADSRQQTADSRQQTVEGSDLERVDQEQCAAAKEQSAGLREEEIILDRQQKLKLVLRDHPRPRPT
jgi:hypothetical protein